MTLERLKQLGLLAAGFRRFVRHPVTESTAAGAIRERLARREERFLEIARRLIYDVPGSPYRKLLHWAGCSFHDLESGTRSHGIEAMLGRLRDAGAYLTLDEFKCRTPIVRTGLTIETVEADFDQQTPQAGVAARTSGSSGKSTRVLYDWPFIAEESANELLLYTAHGVQKSPVALWYPMPPGAAGIHNLLMNTGWGGIPEKWFSHSRPDDAGTSREARLGLQFLRWNARLQGVSLPMPEFADTGDASRVVAWMLDAQRRRGSCVVRTYVSSAVRIAHTALETGADLSHATVFVGGEPLTDHRRAFIESAGLKVFPRYVTTETGLVAAACPHRAGTDDMHLYTDRLALVPMESGYLFTSLTPHASKVVFNAVLGDFGEVSHRSCSCLLGEVGLSTHLSGVRSAEKITIEGMTLFTSELEAMIGAAIRDVGGAPDSYQFRETQNRESLTRLVIAVSPRVTALDEHLLIETILRGLEAGGPRTALAAHFLRLAQSIEVVREEPQLTGGHKLRAAR